YFDLTYKNVGKGGAIGLNWAIDSGFVDAPPAMDGYRLRISRNATCDGLEPRREGPISYPDSDATTFQFAARSGITAESFKSSKKLVYARGCVAYRTLKETKRSAFCWYFIPNIVAANPNAAAAICKTGNWAE